MKAIKMKSVEEQTKEKEELLNQVVFESYRERLEEFVFSDPRLNELEEASTDTTFPYRCLLEVAIKKFLANEDNYSDENEVEQLYHRLFYATADFIQDQIEDAEETAENAK